MNHDNKADLMININKMTINSKIQIAIVDKYKLLGVVLDNKLGFSNNVAEIATKVNKKFTSLSAYFIYQQMLSFSFSKHFCFLILIIA